MRLINLKQIFVVLSLSFTVVACATGGTPVPGNEQGSAPINEKESIEYKQSLIRCQKTGGSRIIKVEGQLRCF
jgi:hypothetical protein